MMNSHSVVGTTGEVVNIMIHCIATISDCIDTVTFWVKRCGARSVNPPTSLYSSKARAAMRAVTRKRIKGPRAPTNRDQEWGKPSRATAHQ